MASETKLLPCPWCGGTDLQTEATETGRSAYRCGECWAWGPEGYDTESAAAEWNHRTPPPADAGREALVTALGEIAT